MFKYLREYNTERSIVLQWKPGFDGGSEQTFILRYKLQLGNNWTKIVIPDAGDRIMNYSLISLESDSVYISELFAVNVKGKSLTLNLTFTTEGNTLSLLKQKECIIYQ
jgi:hypothetical protein